MKISFIFKIINLIYILLLFSCWSVTDEPALKTFYRPGEDPGKSGFTNYQYVTNVVIKGNILLTINDPQKDDFGDGGLRLPIKFVTGVLDIHQTIVSADSDYVYFYLAMQEKFYQSVEEYERCLGGYFFTCVGVFFDKDGTNSGNRRIHFYSPGDGTPSQLDANLSLTNIRFDYGLGVMGSMRTIAGTLFNAFNPQAVGAVRSGPNLTNIEMIKTPVGPGNYSTTIAFKVPRGNWLTPGRWKILVFTTGWEDYGISEGGYGSQAGFPGNNGHIRRNTKTTPGDWTFGSKTGRDVRIADILLSDITTQTNYLSSGYLDENALHEIILP